MMELKLTLWQRAMLVQIINGMRVATVEGLRLALRVLEVLEFSEEERVGAGIVEGGGQMRWPVEAAATVYTVAMEKPELRFVRNAAEGFGGWPVAQAREALDLLEKLGIQNTDAQD